MNEVRLSPISNRESYSESFEVLDEDGAAIDLTNATIVCEIRESGCMSTTALSIAASTSTFTISLTDDQTRSLIPDTEYEIGCTIEIDDFVTQFFIGTLPVVDGIVS